MKKYNKFFVMAILVLSLSIQMSHVFAQDIWIGSDDGCDVYITSETIKLRKRNNTVTNVLVSTKHIRNGQVDESIDWHFQSFQDRWFFEYSKYRGPDAYSVEENTLAKNILDYCLAHGTIIIK